jgi:hypothetical protein
VECRDLAVGDLSSGLNLLPGGTANFTRSREQLNVTAISELVPNYASSRISAIGDNGSNLYGLITASGTPQVVNSVRNMSTVCCCAPWNVMQRIYLEFW